MSAGVIDLVYRPGEDDPSLTLAGLASNTRRGLFSDDSNMAFRDKVSQIGDQTEIALLQFDRLRQAGVVSYDQYASILNGPDQSRDAYGRAIWSALNERTGQAIDSNDPVIRNGK